MMMRLVLLALVSCIVRKRQKLANDPVYSGQAVAARLAEDLGNRSDLQAYMGDIFTTFTNVAFAVLKADGVQRPAQHLADLYQEESETFGDVVQITKPGLQPDLSLDIVNDMLGVGPPPQGAERPTVSNMMGALYGFTTRLSPVTVFKFFQYSDAVPDKYAQTREHIKRKLKAIMGSFRTVFALPDLFSEDDLWLVLREPNCVGQGFKCADPVKTYAVLSEMLSNHGRTEDAAILRLLYSSPSVRSPRARTPGQPYDQVATADRRFSNWHKKAAEIQLVQGNQYYDLQHSLFKRVMDKYGKQVKAGPSGSTRQWMVFVFDVLGVPATRNNLRLLLLCVISDFVPHYHALPEILMVFSVEAANYVQGVARYTLDQDPLTWLQTYNKLHAQP